MPKYLVIVESPAKCKTIGKFLGPDYVIKASYGHVRDLPKSKLGIDVEHNFEPDYTILADKKKVIADLKKDAKKSDIIYLATDPDREGEAIAWHISKALDEEKTEMKRIVFNEITKTALQNALTNFRQIDENLVNAQQARRVLDRLIGYKLSPILSKKIKRGLSAGRVQSVAVRILCEREKLIQAFVSEEYWVIDSVFKLDSNDEIKSKLFASSTDKKLHIANQSEADAIMAAITPAKFHISEVKKKDNKRVAQPPFITSTLQQEASRKLNWSAKKTMLVAQQLYEGIDVGGETLGLITYMRTDSTRLADEAKAAAAKLIEKEFGKKYLSTFQVKSKGNQNIQDAHEAIRPTYVDKTPSDMKDTLPTDQYKLYKLIWDRMLASQMAPAQIENTTIIISSDSTPAYYFKTTGHIIKFDGFMKIYLESTDDNVDGNKDDDDRLPDVKEGATATAKEHNPEQKFTQPPKRFTEAGLVKEMEEKGIGRPSTYAPTISTIIDRKYIDKENRTLIPTELGMVVNNQLTEYFGDFIDVEFTATMERQLDEIQHGNHEWQNLVGEYYAPLAKKIEFADENMDKVSVGLRELGTDPKTSKPVIVKEGRYGPMVQIGTVEDEEKPKFAGIPDTVDMKTITLEEALKLFDFPKTIGTFEDEDVIVSQGRFGPYIKYGKNYVSIPKDTSMHEVTIEDAIALIENKREEDKKKTIKVFSDNDPEIQILNGRYGPYIASNKVNYKIPKDTVPETLTLEQCLEIIKNTPTKKKPVRRKKK